MGHTYTTVVSYIARVGFSYLISTSKINVQARQESSKFDCIARDYLEGKNVLSLREMREVLKHTLSNTYTQPVLTNYAPIATSLVFYLLEYEHLHAPAMSAATIQRTAYALATLLASRIDTKQQTGGGFLWKFTN